MLHHTGAVGPSRLWPLWLAWVSFVVYGSLVPLDFHPLPLDQAWQALLQAPMLNLGVNSRADWVANGVLYLPVGFLSTAMLMGAGRVGAGRRWWAGLFGLVFGVLLAVAVEFAQSAFPPRTVSRNDLLAESIGSGLGMLGALVGARPFRALLAGYGVGGGVLARRLALFYALLFPALALFPFDLLLTAAEWRDKMNGPLVGLWLAESSLGLGIAKLVIKLSVETLAVLPLGALWASVQRGPVAADVAADVADKAGRRLDRRAGPGALQCALWGALLGLLIEGLQLTIVSGQSQGASVLTRAIGFAAGAVAWQRCGHLTLEALRAWLRQVTAPALLVLLALLALYNGAWRGPWLSASQAWRRLHDEVHFVPFYYHYFTTEMMALISLLVVGLSYAPLGVLGWAWHVSPSLVVTLSLLLSSAMEISKLVAQPTHPDPSNIWIAAAAAWLAQSLMLRLSAAPGRLAPTVGNR